LKIEHSSIEEKQKPFGVVPEGFLVLKPK